jgi:hypothetical protein
VRRENGGACSMHGRFEKCILVGKPEGKRPFGRPRHRWEDNTKLDLREIVLEGVDWFHQAQDRDRCQAFVNTVKNQLHKR